MKQFFVVALLLVSACAPSAAAPTLAPTALPQPTALPPATPDPYRALDSVPMFPYPMPVGYLPGEIEHEAPSFYAEQGVPPAALTVSVPITSANTDGGLVTVLVYDDPAERDAAYMALVADMKSDTETIAGVGEHATGKQYMIFETQLVFVRCRALVDIRRFETIEIAPLIENAQHLDADLQPLLCH